MLTIFPPPQPPTWTKHILLFCNLLISAAKATIPRGFRKRYIPLWDDECSTHYQDFLHTQPGDEDAANKASALTDCLDKKRRERWEETVQGIDFSHSSRRAWRTFNRLTGRSAKPTRLPCVCKCHCKTTLGEREVQRCQQGACTSCQTRNICPVASPWSRRFPLYSLHHPGTYASRPPTQECGKAQGPDNIPPEFLIHCGPRCLEWLRGFYSNCLSNMTVPKIWRKATVIAIPKPNKPTDDPKNYRPISLLCVPFKLLERLLLVRLEPIIDPQLPNEQAGFRRGRSTVHQIVNLTDDIEEAFEKGHKAGVILVDLTAAYDTVWHQGSYPEATTYHPRSSSRAVHLYYHL